MTPDLEALLVALVLAPATYSRNRFYDMYSDTGARRMRRRASLIRSIVRHVVASDPERVGQIVNTEELEDGAISLTYVVPAMGLRRTTRVEPIEMALIRYAVQRYRAQASLGPPLDPDDPDTMRITAVLQRLTTPFHDGPPPLGAQARGSD